MKTKLFSLVAMAAMTASVMPAVAQHLTGAGGTFPNPIYQRWFTEYSQAHPGVQINYQSVGSGAGIRQISQGIVDFGASDGPMTDKQLAESKQKLLHIPTVLGAVVPAYNLPGVSAELKFSGDVIADIYLGKITKWNDPRIVKDNPGVKSAKPPDPSGVSFGRIGHQLHLHGLPEQGQPGLQVEDWFCDLGAMAWRRWTKGE